MSAYLECILVFYDVGMFELFEDGDLSADFLFGDELPIHLFYCNFSACSDIFASINFSKGALADAIFFGEDIFSHLDLYLVVHSVIYVKLSDCVI